MNVMTDFLFHWRTMEAGEAPAIHALHSEVAAATPRGMVRPDGLEHFQRHVAECGRILGCFADGDLVAYGVLGMDSPTVDHLAELLRLRADERARLCVLDGAASLPEWRGRRLHCAAIEERMALGRELGRTLVAATVAPENMRSLRGLLLEGFSVHGYAIVYGGLARLIVRRDLLQAIPEWTTVRRVPSADHEGHQRALAEGLQGFHCWQDEHEHWHVDYGHIKNTAP
ncbi:hypothetical protein [Pseudoduganella namucuonensis]|uniref:N-acetyltransferase domain-containing protein n=1 Tax=Pseudoduganella namucuonensis TaxID=1035707 RepID=A0A1I7L4M5_9BURK|nr:hypothetical protein [Pseudoduganella namucuonensis]SFV04660.1 hypothetical protein SAMN05216552_102326 [Pseudoduganella namucuonensis]